MTYFPYQTHLKTLIYGPSSFTITLLKSPRRSLDGQNAGREKPDFRPSGLEKSLEMLRMEAELDFLEKARLSPKSVGSLP